MYLIKEKIYGNLATVYHRTKVTDLANKIYTSGFRPGDGDMYGTAFYSTYELNQQQKPNMEKTYGSVIAKFVVPIGNFFIFDYEEFVKSPTFKKLKSPSEKNFMEAQFIHFKLDYSQFDFSIKPIFTSNTAL